ncbi:MAG: class I SAM-dependent methyltransferase [Bacteroidetes bacterium]|nr:class I SAM-dependent methyltransferase [Bacteroidota bacterium]
MWFDGHKNAYQSELLAVKQFIPVAKEGIEIGVGSGRFASQLGIKKGIEPAPDMAQLARSRGIEVDERIAENLPYAGEQFNLVLMVTIDCFLNNIEKAYSEASRVLKSGGQIVVGFLDKNGETARKYKSKKVKSSVYKQAHFHSPEEMVSMLMKAGFGRFEFCQTLLVPDPEKVETPVPGYGKGSFVVVSGIKS